MPELPRSTTEIVARMKAVAERDFHGVERSRLLEALPFDDALPFLRPDSGRHRDEWEAHRYTTTERVVDEIRSYCDFAWRRANECSGVSSTRAISHFRGLLWLLGDGGPAAVVLAKLEDPDGYAYYGKPQLVAVSEFVTHDWRANDNDQWVNQKGDEPLTATAVLGR